MYSLCPISLVSSSNNLIIKFRSTTLSVDYMLLILNMQIQCKSPFLVNMGKIPALIDKLASVKTQ